MTALVLALMTASSLAAAEPRAALGSLRQEAQDPPAAPPPAQGAVVRRPRLPENALSEAEAAERLEGLFERIRLSDDVNEYRKIYDSEVLPLIQAEYRHARKLLPEILARTTNQHVKLEIRRAIAEVPVFKLRLQLAQKPAVGRPIDVRAEIRNVDVKEHWAVRALDGSDEWDNDDSDTPRRFPHFKVEIEGPDGSRIRLEPARDSDKLTGLSKWDFLLLAPERKEGDRFDPHGVKGAWPNQFLSGWTPQEPGRHILRLTVDYTSESLKDWNCPLESVDKELSGLFSRVPNVEFSETIVLDVADRAQ